MNQVEGDFRDERSVALAALGHAAFTRRIGLREPASESDESVVPCRLISTMRQKNEGMIEQRNAAATTASQPMRCTSGSVPVCDQRM